MVVTEAKRSLRVMGLGLAFISFTFPPPRYNPIQLSKSRLVTGSSPIHPFVTFTPDNYAAITLPIQFDASIIGSTISRILRETSEQTYFYLLLTLAQFQSDRKERRLTENAFQDLQMTWNEKRVESFTRSTTFPRLFQYNAAIEFSSRYKLSPSKVPCRFIRARNVIRTSSPP